MQVLKNIESEIEIELVLGHKLLVMIVMINGFHSDLNNFHNNYRMSKLDNFIRAILLNFTNFLFLIDFAKNSYVLFY